MCFGQLCMEGKTISQESHFAEANFQGSQRVYAHFSCPAKPFVSPFSGWMAAWPAKILFLASINDNCCQGKWHKANRHWHHRQHQHQHQNRRLPLPLSDFSFSSWQDLIRLFWQPYKYSACRVGASSGCQFKIVK